MTFADSETWVVEHEDTFVGFFTFYRSDGELKLGHFYVDDALRHTKASVALCLECLDQAHDNGFERLIVHSRFPYISRFIARTFKAEPYARNDNYDFFCLEVGR